MRTQDTPASPERKCRGDIQNEIVAFAAMRAILLSNIQHVIRSKLPDDRQLLAIIDAGNARSGCVRDLDRDAANRTARAVDQHVASPAS